MVASIVENRSVRTTQIMEITYRLGWHDRDLLTVEHVAPPTSKPDLRLVERTEELGTAHPDRHPGRPRST
jgi:hypothetical protein